MSSAPLLKLVWVNTAPFKDQPQLIRDALNAGSRDEACIHLYTGTQAEDANISGWFSTWKSQAEHDAVVSIPDHPARAFQSTIFAGAGTESGPKVILANLVDSLEAFEKALTSPFTEVTELRLKPGVSQTNFDARAPKALASLQAAGAYAIGRAQKVGDDTASVILAGWDSPQAHFKAIAEGTQARIDLESLKEVATVESVKHVNLTTFK